MELLQEIRLKKGMTQEQLGTAAGLTAVTIQRIESGAVTPHKRTREKLEELLKCQIDWVRQRMLGNNSFLQYNESDDEHFRRDLFRYIGTAQKEKHRRVKMVKKFINQIEKQL